MRVFRKFGFKEMSFREFRERIIFVFIHFYNGILKLFNIELDKVFFQITHSNEKPEPFPGIKESLEFLHKKGVRLAVLSYHLQEELEKDIKDWGLQNFFIDKEGSVRNKKRAIVRLMKRNNFKPEETAYFGDMVLDVKAGKKVGIRIIAVSWGCESRKKLEAAKPDDLIDNSLEIKRIIP